MNGASRVRSTGLGLVVILVNVLIVALVAIGLSQRGFTGWWETARGDWSPPAVTDPYADDEEASAPEDPAVTSAPPEEPDEAETTEEPEETEDPLTLAERFEDEQDLNVLVLGDRTGAHVNDWVAALARDLSDERQVELINTTAADALVYGDVETLGEGEATISFWNASMYGGTAGYVAEQLDPLTPPEEPDLVLLNFGRANTPEDLSAQLDALWEATGEEFPDAERVVVVQPPRRDGLPPTTEATRAWAEENDAPVIDVAQDFEDAQLLDVTVSTRDPLSVNIFGGERWAQLVRSGVFGGPGPGEQTDPADPGAGAESSDDADVADADAPGAAGNTVPGSGSQEPASAQPAPSRAPVEPTVDPAPWQAPPAVPSPSDPPPAAPGPTEPTTPEPTTPQPTDPSPSDPAPTEPGPTDPDPAAPTDPTAPPTDTASGPASASARSPRTLA